MILPEDDKPTPPFQNLLFLPTAYSGIPSLKYGFLKSNTFPVKSPICATTLSAVKPVQDRPHIIVEAPILHFNVSAFKYFAVCW